MKKLLALIFVIFLILPSLSLNTLSKEENNIDEPAKESFIKKFLRFRFKIGFIPKWAMGRYLIQQLRPPVPIQAYPESVSLIYNNKTYFEIGGKSPKTGEWEKMVKVFGTYSCGWMNRVVKYSFEVVPFENSSMDVWNIEFDPPVIETYPNRKNLDWPGAETPFKTNVSIMLKSNNVDPSIFTQDVVLKVNIIREEALDRFGLLKGVPKYVRTHREEYIQKERELGVVPWFENFSQYIIYKTIGPFSLFVGNLRIPIRDKWVDSTVEVLIKVDKYHLAEIEAPLPFKIEPYEVKSIPVTIKNLGSHIDTYNFRVKCDDENIAVTPPPALTLEPGEEKQALVGVAAPRSFYTPGAITSIFVEAYSVDDPENVFKNTILLKTSGVHTTGSATYNSAVLLIALIFIVLLFFYFSNKRKEKLYKKPKKPWILPKEKEKLKKLKEKDEEKYNKTLKKMEKKYEEELSLYKDRRKTALKQIRKKKSFTDYITRFFDSIKGIIGGFINLFKQRKKIHEEKISTEKYFCMHCGAEIHDKTFVLCPQCGSKLDLEGKEPMLPEKPVEKPKIEEKPVEIQEVKEQKTVEEPQKPIKEVKQVTPTPVDREAAMAKWEKEQAILRVMREQEKQKRKLRK